MATFQNGNRRSATQNTVTSMKRSAESRQCPKCRRKSALIREVDTEAGTIITICRWSQERSRKAKRGNDRNWFEPLCDYSDVTVYRSSQKEVTERG